MSRRIAVSNSAPSIRAAAAGLAIAAVLALCGCSASEASARYRGDAHAGANIMTQMACGSCHEIPGLPEAKGKVGPSLAGYGRQKVIAGVLPNSQVNLVRYLLDPRAVVPGNVMPDEHLTPRQARDAAAYLLGLR